MNNQSQTKRSTWSWLAELAERRKGEYLLSVLVALSGVACSLMPYLVMIELIHTLVGGTADKAWCLNRCAVMGLWWVLRYALALGFPPRCPTTPPSTCWRTYGYG